VLGQLYQHGADYSTADHAIAAGGTWSRYPAARRQYATSTLENPQ